MNTVLGFQNVQNANRDYIPCSFTPSLVVKHAFQVRCESTVKVEMRASNLEDGTGVSLIGGTLLPEQWGHVAFAIDSLGHCKLIVDGAEVASGVFRGVVLFCLLLCLVFLRRRVNMNAESYDHYTCTSDCVMCRFNLVVKRNNYSATAYGSVANDAIHWPVLSRPLVNI